MIYGVKKKKEENQTRIVLVANTWDYTWYARDLVGWLIGSAQKTHLYSLTTYPFIYYIFYLYLQ